jgi:hypothetical protein
MHLVSTGQLAPASESSNRTCCEDYLGYGYVRLLALVTSYMLKTRQVLHEMLGPINLKDSRSRRWWAAVVLIAVCSLAVSVATRYSKTQADFSSSITRVHKRVAPEPSRQRLLKTASTSIPPIVSHFILQSPSSYPRVAPAGPCIPNVLLEETFYNRPPPSSTSLS